MIMLHVILRGTTVAANYRHLEVNMPEWIWFIVAFAAYIVIMRWILPWLGVST
jgi:hypothetical protein